MAYEISVEGTFAAAHALRGYGGACERLHGHNFKARVKVRVSSLNDVGIALDFKVLAAELAKILEGLDHQNLNDLEPFTRENATAENIASYVYGRLAPRVVEFGATLTEVTIEESAKYAATYIPDR